MKGLTRLFVCTSVESLEIIPIAHGHVTYSVKPLGYFLQIL